MNVLFRWLRRPEIEEGLREEMGFHIQERIATLVARGMSREEASRTARLEFGNREAYHEECRGVLGYRPWDELRSDLRFAARSLRHQPGRAATVIAILAVAIGVNSAFFTLFSHHVLKPLPFRGAERHFDLAGLDRQGQRTGGWTAPEIEALRQAGRQQVEDLYTERTIQVLALEPAQRLCLASFVSGNYFRLLGGRAAFGRTLSETGQHEPVAVLSHSGQRRFFPENPAPLGKRLRVRAAILTVVGVMPAEFTGGAPVIPDFWTGAEMMAAAGSRSDGREPRYSLSGLLLPQASVQQAEPALTAAARRFSRPAGQAVDRVRLTARSAFVAADGGVQAAAGLVFALFLLVLAIACANLANLFLSRAAARTHEIGMRLALGASRSRIVRQLLTESTLVALLGAGGGVALGVLAVQEAQRYLGAFTGGLGIAVLPAETDGRVLLFSAVLGILAGLAFGLLPALEFTAPSLVLCTKREHSRFAGRMRPRRMRDLLLAGQVACSLVLLLVAGVLVRRVHSLNTVWPGYDLDRVFDLGLDQTPPDLLARIGQEPSVAAAAVERVPLYGVMSERSATVEQRALRLAYNRVDHRFFAVLGLTLEGRGFTAQEAAGNAKVVVISRATARRLWPEGAPLGRLINFGPEEPAGAYQVIGVAPDIISSWLFRGADATAVYFPAAAGQGGIESAMVRIHGRPAAVLNRIRHLCATGADAAGCEPASLREVARMQRFPFQAAAAVSGALGILALALTAVGLYSVISYSVAQRRREIGVHIALGASSVQVARRILREAWRCVAVGVALGLPVCLSLSYLLHSAVLGISAFDPGAYAAIPALLALVTTLACAIPARRAARIHPMELLREE